MTDREVMQQALEALEAIATHGDVAAVASVEKGLIFLQPLTAALRARLAEPDTCKPALQEARRPLTDEEIDRITRDRWGTQLLGVMVQAHREFARAIERAHGITGANDD